MTNGENILISSTINNLLTAASGKSLKQLNPMNSNKNHEIPTQNKKEVSL